MRSVIVAALLLAACSYDEPRYDQTRFRCDEDDPCPPGQQCIDGRCELGDEGIKCGAAGVCATGTMCCAAFGNLHCAPLGEQCNGQAATCDGVGDCATGMRCCGTGASTSCGADTCDPAICTVASDCPAAQPACCFENPTVPWGTCRSQC